MKTNVHCKLSVLCLLALSLAASSTSFGQSPPQTTILWAGPPLIDPIAVVVSPDGTTLYVTDYYVNGVFRMPATGGTPTLIASGPLLANTREITISPNGNTLYIAVAGTGGILSLPSGGGTPTVLASGLREPNGIAISPDGTTLFIADYSGGVVFSLPVAGGRPTPLASASDPIGVAVSPDGVTLYFSTLRAGVFSLPAVGGTPRLIAPIDGSSFAFAGDLALSSDGTRLFVFDPTAIYGGRGPAKIHSLPVEGGPPTLLLSGPPAVTGSFMSASPDGKKLFVTDTGYSDRYGTGWGIPNPGLGTVYVVHLTPPNRPPVAIASQRVFVGNPVELDGTQSSDADGDPVSLTWSLDIKPGGSAAALLNPNSPTSTLVPDLPGQYVVRLVAFDGKDSSVPSEVRITAQTPKQVTESLIASVGSLVNSGALKSTLADALVGKLGAALEQLDRGNTQAAASQLEAFINQVTGLANAGKLSSSQAQSLIAPADQIIRHL